MSVKMGENENGNILRCITTRDHGESTEDVNRLMQSKKQRPQDAMF